MTTNAPTGPKARAPAPRPKASAKKPSVRVTAPPARKPKPEPRPTNPICKREKCKARIPDIAVDNNDAFCSASCARIYFKVDPDPDDKPSS